MKKSLIIVASILSSTSLARFADASSTPYPPTVTWHDDTNQGEQRGSDEVSGTDVVARPEFHQGTYPLASARLLIQGNTVRTWNIDSTVLGTYTPKAIMWASTTCAAGTSVTVRAECTDTQGKTGAASFSVTAYNRAYVLGNTGDLSLGGNAVAAVQPNLSNSNHSVTGSTSDSRAVILANIPDYTVFYNWTHGSPSGFLDTGLSTSANWISDSDVGSAVTNKTDQPAYNFVFIDACKTGQTTTFNGAFGTPTYLGWSQNAPDKQAYVDWTGRVFRNLANFKTVGQAVWHAGPTDENEIGSERGLTEPEIPSGSPAFLFPVISGNGSTTLRGVYGSIQGEWYRELP